MSPDRALHALARLVAGVLIAAGTINTAWADPVFDRAQKYFPQADRMGVFEGEPLAVSVYAGVSEMDLKYFVYQYLDITVEDRVKLGGAEREGPASCLNCSLSVS